MTEHRKLIAILRGIKPDEAVEICRGLADAGITQIEVPLNSPDPFNTIAQIGEDLGQRIEFGAGTVTTVDHVERLAEIGANFVVSPNCNVDVIRRTKEQGMNSYPGIITPSEAYWAIDAGADALKIFPAGHLGPSGISAMKAALPEIDLYAVGGAEPSNFAEYQTAGCSGFGLGSYLYRPGDGLDVIVERANLCVRAYDALVR
jgi:2-dehydro-3-deoxyphosphogalactonate aldolase